MRRFDARMLCASVCALAFTFSFVPRAIAAEDSSGPRRLVVEKVDESRQVTLKTAVPGAVKRSTDEGSVAADRKMNLQLVLKRTPEQQQALEAFVKETQTPGNGNFGKTISPEIFTETFGLAKSDVEAVTKWLESHGFEVKGSDGGGLRLSFTGSAAEVEEAFHTEIHNYKTPDGEIRFANIGDLRIPEALEPVVRGVAGLQDFVRVRIVGFDGPVARPGTEPRGEEAAPVKELNPGWTSPISGGSQLAKAGEGRTKAHPELVNATTTTVGLVPATVVFASGTSVVVTTTVTWSVSSPTPTGTVALSDSQGVFSALIDISSCVLGTEKYTCTYNWNTASAGGNALTDVVTASYSGDTNFDTSTGSKTLDVTGSGGFSGHVGTNFSISSYTAVEGTAKNINFTIDIIGEDSQSPTGALLVWLSSPINAIKSIASMGAGGSGCTYSGFENQYACSFTWNTGTAIPAGSYGINWDYSGNSHYDGLLVLADQPFIVTASGTTPTTTTITANPTVVTGAAPATTFTTVTTWTGSGAQATGSLAITTPSGNPYPLPLGGAAYPGIGFLTSSGSGTYDFGAGDYNYNCVTSTSAKTVTCTVYSSAVYGALENFGGNTVTGTYYGDTVYKGSSGTTTVTASRGITDTLSVVAAPTNVNYGAGTSVTYTATLKGGAGDGQPTGTVKFDGSVITGTPITVTIASGNCTHTGGFNPVYTCTISSGALVVPATATTSAVTATYSGDGTYKPNTATVTLTVNTDATHTTVAAVPASLTATHSTVLTATVTNTTVPAVTPTGGTVTFTDTTNSTTLGSCTLATGTCNIMVAGTAFALGANTVSASYSGVTGEFGTSSGTTTVTITGSADIVFTSVTHNFGYIASGGTTSGDSNYGVQVTNNLATPYAFSVSILGSSAFTEQNNCPASIAAGGHCEIVFIFAPQTTGPLSATWSLGTTSGITFGPSNGGTLSGTGVSSAAVSLSSAGHNFGSLLDGNTSAVYGAVLTNSSASDVTLTHGTVSAPFSIVLNNCPATLVAGASCNLQFEFKPTAAGAFSQTFTLSSTPTGITSGGNPVSGITLSGTGVAAGGVTLSTAQHNFGTVTDGTTSPVYGVVLTNGTGAAVTLSLGSVVAPFTTVVNNCPPSLPSAGTCNLQFTFSPTSPGQTSQEYAITVNGGAVPITSGGATVTGVTLIGTGQ
jgi:hypothetical protein